MKKTTIFAVGLIAVLAIIFAVTNFGAESAKELSAEEIKQLVNDYSTRKITADAASITSKQLMIANNGEEHVYKLPEDEFFVSIAPFYSQTHPCANHSLTTCQGELAEEEFHVFIEDTEGNVLIDRKMTTFTNGFIDLWLPRDHTFHVTIEKDGKRASSQISTFEGDNTCITTIQLS